MDANQCAALRRDIEHAFKAIQEKHQVEFKLGKITYRPTYATAKLTMTNLNAETGEYHNKEASDFEAQAYRYGLKPEYLGLVVSLYHSQYGMREFQIVGLKSRSHKYPILVKDILTDQLYKYPAAIVRQAIEKITKSEVFDFSSSN